MRYKAMTRMLVEATLAVRPPEKEPPPPPPPSAPPAPKEVEGPALASPGYVPLERVTAVVLFHLGLTLRDLHSGSRMPHVVLARRMVALVARRCTFASFPEINAAIRGHAHGHSTAVNLHQAGLALLEQPITLECRFKGATHGQLVVALEEAARGRDARIEIPREIPVPS